MSVPRLCVLEYMQASEILLKIDDLTDVEMEAVQVMVTRLSEKFSSGPDGKPWMSRCIHRTDLVQPPLGNQTSGQTAGSNTALKVELPWVDGWPSLLCHH